MESSDLAETFKDIDKRLQYFEKQTRLRVKELEEKRGLLSKSETYELDMCRGDLKRLEQAKRKAR